MDHNIKRVRECYMKHRITTNESKKLWEDFQSGDMYALANLMQCYYSDLVNWGLRLHNEREFVKDCIQDMFEKLWMMRKTINSVENVRPYLMTILKTSILRELTNKHVTHQSDLNEEYTFSVEFASDLRLIDEENEVFVIRKLEMVLNHLSSRQKELIYLKFYQNLSFEEIGEIMNLSRQSVYNLHQKSLYNLRKHYDIT